MSKPSYKIIKLLGEGSYGRAFLCTDKTDNSQCVIKQITIQNMNKNDINITENINNFENINNNLEINK